MSIIEFPLHTKRQSRDRGPYKGYRRRRELSMHTAAFRSYNAILESDEADLVRDVGLDMDKARTKLQRIQRAAQRLRERAELQMLEAAEVKLRAAIVAALLSKGA